MWGIIPYNSVFRQLFPFFPVAVFTEVSLPAFNGWAHPRYGMSARELMPISEGIENTNYQIIMENGGEFVFTIFELWDAAAVDYYAALMRHLNAAALPVPAPQDGADGSPRQLWGEKPALLVPFVQGAWAAAPLPRAV